MPKSASMMTAPVRRSPICRSTSIRLLLREIHFSCARFALAERAFLFEGWQAGPARRGVGFLPGLFVGLRSRLYTVGHAGERRCDLGDGQVAYRGARVGAGVDTDDQRGGDGLPPFLRG